MTSRHDMHFVLPGPMNQRTGGYLYDARIVGGLRRLGWGVTVHSIEGTFPDPDEVARENAEEALRSLPDGARVVIDGLALPALSDSRGRDFKRLQSLALVHHLTYEETGINSLVQNRLKHKEAKTIWACRGVIVTSEFTVSRVKSLGVAESLIRAVEPGTEPARPARGPDPGKPLLFLSVGSVIPRKGQDTLVRALALLRDHPWTCVLAGSLTRDPDFANKVQQLVAETGLTRRIRFVGECDEPGLEDLYDRSSLFVLASHHEGYGMAISEALARGLPIVSTTGGAIPDTVPRDAGILVPPGDHEALGAAIGSLIEGPEDENPTTRGSGEKRRAELAAAARECAARLPGWDRQAQAFGEAVLSLTPDS